jgi:Fur family peroxide stress response transcriptional regulator
MHEIKISITFVRLLDNKNSNINMQLHKDIVEMLKTAGLKVTPQRTAILEAICRMKNHPTADQITRAIHENFPGVSQATVYNTLETLVKNGLVNKVKTDRDIMRYEMVIGHHHHLYCKKSDRIEDFSDPGLQEIIESYFGNHHIPGFRIEDIRLQIIGEFIKS